MLGLALTNLIDVIQQPMRNYKAVTQLKTPSLTKSVLLLLTLALLTFLPLLFGLDLPELPHEMYLPLHTMLEVIAVVVAALIFAVIREQALVKMTLRGAVIASAFFAIFWLDLAHLLSFKGMPAYFSTNDFEKTVNFWLAARLVAALALFFIVLPLADKSTTSRRFYQMLLSATIMVLALHYWFIALPHTVPRTFIEGQGLTSFKIAAEYLVILINLITVLFIVRYRRSQSAFHTPALLAAVVTMALSEFYFTLYSQMSDSFNILGHVLKLLSYLFLYRALIYETLAAPYAMLQQSRAELTATLSAVPDILFEVDLDGRFYQVHRRPEVQLYLEPEQFLGKTARQVLPQQVVLAVHNAIQQAYAQRGCSEAQHYTLTIGSNSEPSWFQVIAAYKGETAGQLPRFILAVRDISMQKKAQATEQLNALAFHTREAIMITDAQQRIIRVNPAFTDITGYSEAEVVGKNPTVLSSGLHDKPFYQHLWQTLQQYDVWSGEIYNRRKNGEVYPEHVVINALKDDKGVITHYIASFNDISKAKADQQRIHHLAYYDPLTQLPNRRLLLDKIAEIQNECQRSNDFAALLFIDLDHFKQLNDSLGHSYGDELLCQLAERLQLTIRATDTLARPGGDEFILLARLLTKEQDLAAQDAQNLGNKLLQEIRQPFLLKQHQYHLTASIGIALFNDNSKPIDELLSSADLAMYHSKERGRNQLYFFEQHMQENLRQRQQLEQGLKQTLANNEFRLFYQPKVNKEGKLAGYEALLRWQRPGHGLVPPDQFIPLAESTGLIIDIGQWVLQTACEQIKQFCNQGTPLPIAVNVSQRQLAQKNFVATVQHILTTTAIDPHLLELELTESMLHDNLDSTRHKLTLLNQQGVCFSLDDFGTGYSSLSYLKNLPISVLKIDKSFVREFLSQDTDHAIVRTILAMAESLSLRVVAEGVEQQAQFDELVALGCDLFQGYLFGKPAPLNQAEYAA
ncbi:EAL domain-containing protein [Rheinheimera sp. FR7-31]|uniref:bifunctional diguanylate cyclase/phosphodiesterase n=1 Tax=Rheinheimera fenheensis TaxID=3152295 RepID=UPI00325C5924